VRKAYPPRCGHRPRDRGPGPDGRQPPPRRQPWPSSSGRRHVALALRRHGRDAGACRALSRRGTFRSASHRADLPASDDLALAAVRRGKPRRPMRDLASAVAARLVPVDAARHIVRARLPAPPAGVRRTVEAGSRPAPRPVSPSRVQNRCKQPALRRRLPRYRVVTMAARDRVLREVPVHRPACNAANRRPRARGRRTRALASAPPPGAAPTRHRPPHYSSCASRMLLNRFAPWIASLR